MRRSPGWGQRQDRCDAADRAPCPAAASGRHPGPQDRYHLVYKVDRLTRSLADFVKLVELFDAHGVSFVSVAQQFNTTTSMGRPTLNVLLSFAQFE
jgi:DNA invertase Pin-like site-specific DNA recombinase